jgi:signal transduction histidine kinase
MIWLPIVAISVLHYSTGSTHHGLHDVFRRLYYIPIILAAFTFGIRGALAASVAASLIYAPHAFTQLLHHDPAGATEKMLEILLYNIIAVVSGVLADKEYRERKNQADTVKILAQTIKEKEETEQLLVRAGRLQALGELTAGLAHELKNPLASIMGASETIIDEIPPDSPKQKMADVIMKELNRLKRILERFLTFASPEQYDLSEISIGEQVNDVVGLLDSQARQNDVALITQPGSADVTAIGEKEKVVQVLMNLVLNAVQASPKGGAVRISCSYETRGNRKYGMLSVEDEGSGVADNIREQIFNPFFTTKDEGSGLGLAIAARIVDQHKGFIEVKNGAKGGARFEVYLPVEKATL